MVERESLSVADALMDGCMDLRVVIDRRGVAAPDALSDEGVEVRPRAGAQDVRAFFMLLPVGGSLFMLELGVSAMDLRLRLGEAVVDENLFSLLAALLLDRLRV